MGISGTLWYFGVISGLCCVDWELVILGVLGLLGSWVSGFAGFGGFWVAFVCFLGFGLGDFVLGCYYCFWGVCVWGVCWWFLFVLGDLSLRLRELFWLVVFCCISLIVLFSVSLIYWWV